jgi:hypothetical protein
MPGFFCFLFLFLFLFSFSCFPFPPEDGKRGEGGGRGGGGVIISVIYYYLPGCIKGWDNYVLGEGRDPPGILPYKMI